MSLRLSFVVLLAALGLACQRSGSAASSTAADCSMTLRRPADRRVVLLEPTGPRALKIDCGGHSRCVVAARGATLAALAKGGTLDIRVGEHRWQRPQRSDARQRDLSGLRGAVVGGNAAAWLDGGSIDVFEATGDHSRFSVPPLEPDEKIAGVSAIVGGLALTLAAEPGVIRPTRRRVWLRLPPTEARLWPAGAEPVFRDPELVGWIVRDSPWAFIDAKTGARRALTLAGDSAHAPHASVYGDVVVEQHGARVRLTDLDGARFDLELHREDQWFGSSQGPRLLRRDGSLFAVSGAGLREIRRARPGDLLGARLPAGATRTRLRGTQLDDDSIVVIERIGLPSCRAEDRVHIVDVTTGVGRTVAGGDRVRLHPFSYNGRAGWLEGRASYTFAGAD